MRVLHGTVLLGVLLLAACSPGLRVDSYPAAPGSSVNCDALFADVPQRVAGEDKIRVDGDNAVAWGAPPIILRCGVEKPSALTKSSECFPVRDVGWFVETTADGFLFTTIGRELFVSVEVPSAYEPEADALADLATTIEKHVPLVKPCV